VTASALRATTSSTQNDTGATTSATSQSDAAGPTSPPKLVPAAVDQSLLVGIDSAPRHSHHPNAESADESMLDELFVVV
jgi:hypothetical protein